MRIVVCVLAASSSPRRRRARRRRTGKGRSATCRSCTKRRRPRASTASTTARGSSSSAAAGRRSIATAPAFPRCSWLAARIRRSSSSTSRRPADRSSSRRSRSTSAPIRSCSTNVIGAYPIDIDGDGHMDLFVLRVGGNLLLKGGPDCTFTLANKEWNFDGDPGWTTSFAAEWEPGQKFPTLAIGHYVDRDAPGSPWGTCEDNSLYRPQPGDKPDYSVRTPLAPGFCALSMLFTDWNKSGVPSLRVSNDRQYYRGGEEQMWRIEPGQDAPPLHPRRRLAASVDLRHGHRRGRHRRLRLPRIFPHLDGRREAAEARSRRGGPRRAARLSRHRRRGRRDRAYSLYGRRQAALDRLARRIRRLQQRRPPRHLRLQGQSRRRCPTSPPTIRAICCSANGTASSPKPATWRASPANAPAAGALVADFNLDGMLDILQIDRGSNVALFRNLGAKMRRRIADADGQLDRDPARRAEPQPQRGRGQDFGQDRNPQPDPLCRRSAAATPPAMPA